MLDRPRHEEKVAEIREVGARIRFISDGDVSAALFAVSADAGVDLLWGIGGTPEGVISAAAIKCIGGQLLGKLWPRDEDERQAALDAGYDLDETLDVDRLVSGQDVFFAATGVTDGELLQGVRYSRGKATTESLVMRSRSGTVRTVSAPPRPGEAARGDRRPVRVAPPVVPEDEPKVLVAGATGYIGGLLARKLREDDVAVRCLVRDPAKAGELERIGCEIVRGDVLEAETPPAGARGDRGGLLPRPLDGARRRGRLRRPRRARRRPTSARPRRPPGSSASSTSAGSANRAPSTCAAANTPPRSSSARACRSPTFAPPP